MADMKYDVLTVCLLTLITNLVFAKQRISVTAPMPSVEERGVLAVHCRVWNLAASEEVTILRKTKGTVTQKRLSLREDLVSGTGDRFFLAVRQLDDASHVYFLSIMDVTREDEGEYNCYIVSSEGGFTEISFDSVFVSVFYFPSDMHPYCKGYDNTPVVEGDVIKLNCSSEIANPPITMTWSRAGTDSKFNTLEAVHNGIMYSSMTLKAKLKDNGSVLLCSISSTVFPGENRQCHLGPINVFSTDGSDSEVGNGLMGNARNSMPTVSTSSVTKYTGDINIENMRKKCKKTCSTSSSSLFWIICTVISVILAFVFGVIGVKLIFRFYRKTRRTTTQYIAARRVQDDIYSELDNRRINNKFYMTLVKPDISKSLMLQDRSHEQFDMKLTTHPLNA